MNDEKKLSTESYKGVRDFYPIDMAVERHIFDTWSRVAESFGFERYDASILEPAELYKSKGAENEELVNEQTYTFTDRGEREVTLRPEMTPSVARMVAAKRRELTFPLRWYSIPNLFRYERPQRGRLREHYQLNCDIFGTDSYVADVEIIALAHQMLLNFGAEPEMFEIRINSRKLLDAIIATSIADLGDTKREETRHRLIKLIDKPGPETQKELAALGIPPSAFTTEGIDQDILQRTGLQEVLNGLSELGIKNVVFDPGIMRGFDYYTGTIFEIFDTSGENNRAMLGGGRYDNLASMFSDEKISGIGFGMGDVTMRDFLETHSLITSDITAPTLMIMPMGEPQNLEAEKLAQEFRAEGIATAVDLSAKKIGKKVSDAAEAFVMYALVLGENEIATGSYTVKNLEEKQEYSGTLPELIAKINS